ncbi:conserved hypothetical protein [Candidatus Terasakiella magnetica]|uniref:FeoB-associated Cys-rich membrane protein n=1 Tax=Candidatus Terasakiella magnetica TaxID=1867952 RepID=A0A1C3RFW8_9PROT|nr:FeoB-associated Cys-rich membrane protein [Candidatus Terasakiella magnetica]SCA56104.1 conserved hypothetical protein [Candidatus Terasakiella magnetica]
MEALILTIVFGICIFLAMRHIRNKFNPGQGCGTGCGSCGSAANCDTANEKTLK